jgi:hypothetical protein
MLRGIIAKGRRVPDLRLAVLVFSGTLGLLLFRFAVPRPVGFSDNGDGWRVLCELRADAVGYPNEQSFVQFLYPASPNCANTTYMTTQVWFGRIAQLFGNVAGPRTGLNLSLMAVVFCVFAAAGIALVTAALRVSRRWRVAVSVLLLLVVADSAFFDLFASVDTEGAAFLGLLLTVGGMLALSRPGGWRIAGAAVTVFGGVVAVNAKAQTVPILPLLVVAVLALPAPGQTWRARWAVPLLVVAALVGLTGWMQISHGTVLPGSDTVIINDYDAVFSSILDHDPNPVGDLHALGLPASFSRYIDSYYWGPNSAVSDPLWPRYVAQFSTSNLINYYWHHPGRSGQILNRDARDVFTLRPSYTGSFAANVGLPPATKEWRVPVVSGVMRLAAPLGLAVLLPLWLLLVAGGIRAGRRDHRALAVLVLLLCAVSVSQFLEAALGEGIEGVKHQLIAAFALAFGAVLAIVSLAVPLHQDNRGSRRRLAHAELLTGNTEDEPRDSVTSVFS